jgi:phage tail-like protein
MSLQPGDALVAHRFGIQIDGQQVEYLQEISALTMEQDVITLEQITPDGKPIVRKLPGAKKSGEMTVGRGMDQSPTFSTWISTSLKGDISNARKNATVEVLTPDGASAIKRYHLFNAWVSKLEGATLKAGESAPVTERVTIQFEDITIE